MSKKLVYIPLLVVPTIIGLFHGFLIAESVNVFLSWVLVGVWLCFTVYYFQKLKAYREFGSPHNTTTFILGPLFIGIFYSLWGYYTGILEWNLFGASELYLSFWIIIFALPYLIRGMFALYSCYKRYDVVYIGRKSFNARKFGIFATLTTIIITIVTLAFYFIFSTLTPPIYPTHYGPDLMLIITSLMAIFLLIRYGIFWSQPSLSEISATVRSRDRTREPRITPSRSSRATRSRTSSSQTRTRSSTPRDTTRTRSESTRRRTTTRAVSTRSSTTTRRKTTKPKETKAKQAKVNIKKYLPKAGTLSVEDFKCIMCFQLPKFPADQGRGIVLCPKCKHPAHADEFRDWLKDSNLCSRCDTPLPARFRRNPEIISVKFYVRIINRFAKKGKK